MSDRDRVKLDWTAGGKFEVDRGTPVPAVLLGLGFILLALFVYIGPELFGL